MKQRAKHTPKLARPEYEGIRHLHSHFGIDFRVLAQSTCFLVSSVATKKNHHPSPHVYTSTRLGDMRVGWIFDQAYSLALSGKHREGLARFEEVLRLEPAFVHAWNQKGLCHYFLKEYTLAIKSFNKASALCPTYVESLINRGCALQRLDLFDEALQSFDDAEVTQPGLYETLNNKAISLIALGDFTGALSCLDGCILAAELKPSVYCLRSLCLVVLERISEGVLDLEIVLRLDPLNKHALMLYRAFHAYVSV
ncbi:MAG: tetratricopeptide repeat protein [Halobacteriota archaeon]